MQKIQRKVGSEDHKKVGGMGTRHSLLGQDLGVLSLSRKNKDFKAEKWEPGLAAPASNISVR